MPRSALLALLLAAPLAAAQPDSAGPLVVEAERLAWTGVDEAAAAFEHARAVLAAADAAGPDPAAAADLRRWALLGVVEAARAERTFEFISALRRSRGDADPRCADEDEAGAALAGLTTMAVELVELHALAHEEAAALRDGLDTWLAPLRALFARHLAAPEDPCTPAAR